MKKQVAILITVYNRKNVTLEGLRTLYVSIGVIGEAYDFDIYLVDDGSTDGTGEAIALEYPEVHIIKGDGSLFWGGGMLKAWRTAIDSNVNYEYYVWYNDDSSLEPDAIKTLFDCSADDTIVTGAFCDNKGVVSYGGKDKNNILIAPTGIPQRVYYMNGNLVLVPKSIVDKMGVLDSKLRHGGGDFEYGLRARKNGFKIMLTPSYVGEANRHDEKIPKYCQSQYSMRQRVKYLKSPIYNPKLHFYYNTIAHGKMRACMNFVLCYLGVISPTLYSYIKKLL